MNKQETIEDIIADMCGGPIPQHRRDQELLRHYADRIEAALKREIASIHYAMVLIAGIEMEDSEYPPKLWTALEDAYDALSDALGTDGDATADVQEATAIGRHFVVKSSRDAAKMREALEVLLNAMCSCDDHLPPVIRESELREAYRKAESALAEPPRNCDVGTVAEQHERHFAFCDSHPICNGCPLEHATDCILTWAQMPYEEGGAK